MDILLFALRVIMAAALCVFVLQVLRYVVRPDAAVPRLEPLRLRYARGAREQTLALAHPALIGRDPNCLIQLDDAFVSARHAELRFDAGRWLVADCGSHNGTFVNERRLDTDAVPLVRGDVLRVGGVSILVE
jgi:pSer/pThr/pTyr-binding forkhead associated (FHA) protein